MNETIPVVNLSDFLSNNTEQKKGFVKQLGTAFESVGFVAVKNHTIPEKLIVDLYTYVQKFFSLPLQKKVQYEIKGSAGQRGYTSFGKEHAKGSEAPDLKEFFQFGQSTQNKINDEACPDNVKVNEVPELYDTLYKAYRHFETAGSALLKSIALYLNLNEDYFEEYLKDGNSILRCIHYPPIIQEPKSAIRAEQHEDINLITLLVGSSADGLQILTKNGQWICVTSLPEYIVVNVGDMLQRLTNNKLKSTTHRVTNPPKDLWHTSRFSMPFFLHPRSEMSLASLAGCTNANHPKLYSDITAGKYLDERLKEIGLKN